MFFSLNHQRLERVEFRANDFKGHKVNKWCRISEFERCSWLWFFTRFLWDVYVDEESVGLQQKQPHGLKDHVVFQDQRVSICKSSHTPWNWNSPWRWAIPKGTSSFNHQIQGPFFVFQGWDPSLLLQHCCWFWPLTKTFVKLCTLYPCPELMGNKNNNIHSQNRTLRPWKLKIALPKKKWSSSSSHHQFSGASC